MKKRLILFLFSILPFLAESQATEPDFMLLAFIEIESSFDSTVINHLDYGGILQIGQEMIDEANRICRKRGIDERFILSDRLNVKKSIHIWYIVQDYWNPKYTLRKACKVWNPTASNRYYLKIRTRTIELLQQNMIENLFNQYYENIIEI